MFRIVVLLLQASSPSAQAETLPEALAAAVQANPHIESARARLHAIEEGIAQATAGYLPRVSATADAGYRSDARAWPPTAAGQSPGSGYALTLSQPLFDGGRTSSAVQVTQANVRAERENVQIALQQVLLAATTAYMDVVQNRRLRHLNEDNAALLAQVAVATRRRAEVREATSADLAQADAAVAGARAQVALAKANLVMSEAAFVESVQHPPGVLSRPPALVDRLPAGLDEALQHAHAVSPAVVLAVERAAAARHAIDQANAQLLPSIHLQASYQRRSEPQPGVDDMDGLVAKVVVTVPIYSGGAGQAEVRAARHTHRALAWQAADVRAQVHSAVVQAWARLQATRAASSAIAVQVTASRQALAGIRAEQAVGQRSVLDLITTQQALLASRTSHEQNQRNLVVGCYSLLSAIGRLGPNGSDNPKAAVTPVRDFGMRPSPWTTSVKSGPK